MARPAPVVLPTRGDLPAYSNVVPLDGKLYQCEYAWNPRDSAWYWTIKTQAGEVLQAGVKLVPDWSLLEKFAGDPRFPVGRFFLVDNEAPVESPGSMPEMEDLGTRHLLVFQGAEVLE
jgi:hypothetical protein